MYTAFKDPYDALVEDVRRLDPKDTQHPKAKILKRINDLILDEIPANPGDKAFWQGDTLGQQHKNWFRAKFLRRFRLFFRYNTQARVIIYCWVNDENTLRKAGADTDPYKVFAKMIRSGNPPNDWDELLKAVRDAGENRGT
jgi:toxin YhaV